MRTFALPPAVADLVQARNRLRRHYESSGLTFTLDGNLLGDLGEAIAAELFGMRIEKRNITGIDGYSRDDRSVQVKVTASGRGPAFRMVETRAQHLLFLELDVENLSGGRIQRTRGDRHPPPAGDLGRAAFAHESSDPCSGPGSRG